jgi:hypothetical protein
MANVRDTDLMKTLRDCGLRKKVARAVTDASGKATATEKEMVAKTVSGLRAAADELESRVSAPQRSQAAKKAARTRKQNAAERSAAARKGARTRSRTTA